MTIDVLICDDSNLARKQVRRSLPEDWPCTIQFATNGLEAMEILHNSRIGVLFLDLTMPELDGIGVLERIKAEHIDCFVIVISADIQPEMKKRVEELGALSFIHKPVNPDKLSQIMSLYGLI